MAARRFQFALLTLGLSFIVVTAMVAASGRGADPGALRSVSPEPAGRPEGEPAALRAGEAQAAPSRQDGMVVVPSFADIAERANPAVVNITATEIIRSGDRRRFEGHAPFEFFFPNPDGRPRGEDEDPEREDHGGSGFIISDDGYVLTNYHVIEDADKISVRLQADSREYIAKKVGSDPDTDLALLKVDADRELPTIPLGDSDTLRVGDWVLAIGNPLAYEHTVTVGVVSAKGRKLWALNRDTSLDNFIQTDAAINRGNSGGPLLNARGEAVGINSAITVAAQGISFAIPINMAKDVMAQLLRTGRVVRGFLGVQIHDVARDLDPDQREYFGLSGRRGAFIEDVTPGLPADAAGLRPGDAIVSVDGKALESSDELIRLISAKAPGEKVALGIIRDGREQTLMAELADRKDRPTPARRSIEPRDESEPEEQKVDRSLGIVLHELTPEIRREYQLKPEERGLVIVHVSTTSQAWEKGLREGDRVVEVNRKAVADMDALRAATRSLKSGDLVNLYVVGQQGSSRFVTLRIEKE